MLPSKYHYLVFKFTSLHSMPYKNNLISVVWAVALVTYITQFSVQPCLNIQVCGPVRLICPTVEGPRSNLFYRITLQEKKFTLTFVTVIIRMANCFTNLCVFPKIWRLTVQFQRIAITLQAQYYTNYQVTQFLANYNSDQSKTKNSYFYKGNKSSNSSVYPHLPESQTDDSKTPLTLMFS